MNSDKAVKQLSKALAELVAWNGKEMYTNYSKRLLKAERLLKRLAPEILNTEKYAAAIQNL